LVSQNELIEINVKEAKMIMNPVDEPYTLALEKLNTLDNNHLKQFKELGTISEIMKKVI
jgi:hypothetical protein